MLIYNMNFDAEGDKEAGQRRSASFQIGRRPLTSPAKTKNRNLK